MDDFQSQGLVSIKTEAIFKLDNSQIGPDIEIEITRKANVTPTKRPTFKFNSDADLKSAVKCIETEHDYGKPQMDPPGTGFRCDRCNFRAKFSWIVQNHKFLNHYKSEMDNYLRKKFVEDEFYTVVEQTSYEGDYNFCTYSQMGQWKSFFEEH